MNEININIKGSYIKNIQSFITDDKFMSLSNYMHTNNVDTHRDLFMSGTHSISSAVSDILNTGIARSGFTILSDIYITFGDNMGYKITGDVLYNNSDFNEIPLVDDTSFINIINDVDICYTLMLLKNEPFNINKLKLLITVINTGDETLEIISGLSYDGDVLYNTYNKLNEIKDVECVFNI